MHPYTASSLKEEKHQKMADFLQAAKVFHVTHYLALSMTDQTSSLKISKFPSGPTITFKIRQFTLSKYIILLS